ncbi:hypothetical protein TNCV_3140081 [Trichonephila clavipes]|nr:hypothetical protein TNCV_3140081 [Trichonephila clavipes]
MGKLPDSDAFDRGQIPVDLREYRCSMLARHRAEHLAWEKPHSDWSVEACKRVAWSYEPRFRQLNADGRLRVWRQDHETMDPPC